MNRDYRAVVMVSALIMAITAMPFIIGCPERQPSTTTTTGRAPTMTQGDTQISFPQEITGLDQPIAMAFAPDGRIFITERPGRIRVFENGRLDSEPLATVNVPTLVGYNETGLLGIALHPNFNAQPYVYVYHTYRSGNRLLNRVVRFRTDIQDTPEPETVFDSIPGGRIHNGGIILFGPDGNLYIATGETGNSDLAQDITSLGGKVLRVTPTGDIPADNPFPNSAVYSYGHRNIFGMAFRPQTEVLYVTENGPTGDDEVNRIEAGGNYGWPVAVGPSDDERFIDPVKTYPGTIAPTQAIFYTGDRFKYIRNWFVFGTYVTQDLHALDITGPQGGQAREDRIIHRSNRPIIGVAQSPDGAIYITDGGTIRRIDTLSD